MRYICAIRDGTKQPPHAELITNIEADIIEFARAHDVPGTSVYDCPNILREDATRRGYETLKSVVEFSEDIDYRMLEETPEQIRAKLDTSLPIEPTEIRKSGGGLHLVWRLPEPFDVTDPASLARVRELYKELGARLSADPTPAQPVALRRVLGTHNTKYEGGPTLVEIVGGSGKTVDITDLEEMCDMLPAAGLFTFKGKVNGQEYLTPEEKMDNVAQGTQQGVHNTELSVSASYLNRGISVDEAVRMIVDEICSRVDASQWNREEEEHKVRVQAYDWISKHANLSHLLPDYLRGQFEEKIAAAQRPKIVFRSDRGFHVRGYPLVDNVVEFPKQPAKRVIEAIPFQEFDEAKLKAREWVYGNHYQLGIVTGTVGPGGGGKSSLNLVEMVALATGRNLLGEQPKERLPVWYHNAEDPIDEIYRRLAGIIKHHGIPQSELKDWLFVTSGVGMPMKFGKSGGGIFIPNKDTAAQVIATLEDRGIQVFSSDPLISTHQGAEASTDLMDALIEQFKAIADVCSCSIELTHHVRKAFAGNEDHVYTAQDSRGPVAFTNAVRSLRVLNPMTPSEAEKLSLDEVERKRCFRIDMGKANMAPASAADWYRFESVELLNGDNIGVPVAWERPEADPQKMAAADKVFMDILDRFEAEGHTVNPTSGPLYAPLVFAREPEAAAMKLSKRALTDAMRRLLLSKMIRVENIGTDARPKRAIVRARQ